MTDPTRGRNRNMKMIDPMKVLHGAIYCRGYVHDDGENDDDDDRLGSG